MALGMHPTSLYPRRSRVAPIQVRWPRKVVVISTLYSTGQINACQMILSLELVLSECLTGSGWDVDNPIPLLAVLAARSASSSWLGWATDSSFSDELSHDRLSLSIFRAAAPRFAVLYVHAGADNIMSPHLRVARLGAAMRHWFK